MKKFILSIFAFALILFMVSCGSVKNAGINQREKNGLPRWAGNGVSFFSSEAKNYEAPEFSEKGFYACGVSENLNNIRITSDAAKLSANKTLANYISTEIKSAEKRISIKDSVSYQQIDESFTKVELKGARVVDNYIDNFGNVYSLVFISEDELKKNFTNNPKLTEAIEELTK